MNFDAAKLFKLITIKLLDRKLICKATNRAFLMHESACLTQSSLLSSNHLI